MIAKDFTDPLYRARYSSWLDDDLDSLAAVHLIERLLVVFELERVRHHTFDANLARIEILDSTRETV